MKPPRELKFIIRENAKRIRELHREVQSTLRGLAYGTSTVADQELAAAKFKDEYDALAFQGGFEAGVGRIRDGDCEAIEYALAFLEVWPYFNQSGYMRKKIIRVLKRVSLQPLQARRLDRVLKFEQSKKNG